MPRDNACRMVSRTGFEVGSVTIYMVFDKMPSKNKNDVCEL